MTANQKYSMFKPGKRVSKQRKDKSDKPIAHPIFAECAQLIDDEYWVSLLNNASLAKFPKKFSYRDQYLFFKKSSKSEVLKISDDPETALTEIIPFFQRWGNILSSVDEKMINDERQNNCLEHDQIWSNWCNLKKSTQNQLINSYILAQQRRLFLDRFEKAQLSETISLGVSYKIFDDTRIILQDSVIDQIIGLCFDPGKRKFYIDPSLKMKTVSHSSSSKKTGLSKKEQKQTFEGRWDSVLEIFAIGNDFRNRYRIKNETPRLMLNIIR